MACAALWLVGWSSGTARADDFLATAFEEARVAQAVAEAQSSLQPAFKPTMDTLLAAEVEHTRFFHPDYAEDLANQVESLANSTSPAPLVAAALEHLGVRYRWGGNDPTSGFDCSGLVVYVAREALGVTLPRTAATQARTGVAIKKSELQAGDLVFFNTRGARYSHVGIYAGDGQFIHAPRTGAVVRVETMNSYWAKRYTGARRLPGEVAQVAATKAKSIRA